MRLLKSCAALFALTALACPPSETPGPDPAPQPVPGPAPTGAPVVEPAVKGPFKPAEDTALASLTESNNRFAADLYGQLAKSQTASFAASPISISLALSMAYAGASGETSAQMKQTLGFSLDSDATHRAFGTLLRSWAPKAKSQYELTVANRLFGSKAIAFEPAYLEVTKDHYQAPLEQLDFKGAAEKSREHINAWVAETTKKKITNLIPEGAIGADTLLVLANAIYFNGTWSEKFEKDATIDKPFFAPTGEVKAPTMHMEDHFQYGEADDNKLLTLYYRGGPMAMTIVLPDAKDGLAKTEQAIAADKLGSWTEGMRRANVSIALPKFKISGASISLKDTLTAMGMGLAFDEQRASFRGMAAGGEPNLFIGDVFHKAFVDVHEEGTEAAAATGAVMYPTSAMLPSEPKPFIADHPFVFFIRDAQKGTILFMGRVMDPTT